MENNTNQVLTTCYHCGNTGNLDKIGECDQSFGGPIIDEVGNVIDFELEETYQWYLLQCPVCRKITLFEKYTNESQRDIFDNSILYPYNKNKHNGVPDHIKSAFDSAVKVKGINSAICLLSLRMTLEAICKDKKASGRTLEEMVKNLIERSILPVHLDDACWIIRQLGNQAAHAERPVFNSFEVERVIGFVDRIVDYLYSLPYQINQLKAIIEERKEGKK